MKNPRVLVVDDEKNIRLTLSETLRDLDLEVDTAADGIEGLTRVVRDQIGKGADLIKVYADYRWGPNGEAMPTFTQEELQQAFTDYRAGRMGAVPAECVPGQGPDGVGPAVWVRL